MIVNGKRDTTMRLGVLFCLYLSQGIPFGFFSHAMPAILRSHDVDLRYIGYISALAFPWSLKFIWAPWVDRYGSLRIGHRKSWILPLQAGVILLLCGLAVLDPETLDPLTLFTVAWLLLLVNLAASMQDVASDGLAVNILREQERGYGNGIQVGAFRVGMIYGGGGVLMVIGLMGWTFSFLSMAVLLALATIPLLFFREPPPVATPEERDAIRWWPALTSFMAQPGVRLWLLVIGCFKVGDSLGSGMAKTLLVDIGMSLEEVGLVSGTVAMVAAIVGALLGGKAVLWLGRRRAMMTFGGLQGLSMLGFAGIDLAGGASLAVVAVIVAFEHLVSAMATVAVYTGMMDMARRHHASTDVTLQASVYVFATGGVYVLAGHLAEAVGYALHFTVAAALAFAALIPVRYWKSAHDGRR
jgi:PAT family beta-lactamase induction signal transducer AmpG